MMFVQVNKIINSTLAPETGDQETPTTSKTKDDGFRDGEELQLPGASGGGKWQAATWILVGGGLMLGVIGGVIYLYRK